ncbi:MAG: serine/threonine protein kinase [Deltaproteobacteria bacterium]|nr:serine/threonine protein kinase [Deltaproteobacteria bacterium]
MTDAIPRRLGAYEVLAKLADGGVGTVYVARRTGPAAFQRLVAIKRLHPHYASDASFVTMFTDEARLAARIHHANVVSVLELATDADGYYVVMDYVEGTNLSDLAFHAAKREGKMPQAIALRIVLDALAGLHAAHEVVDDDGASVDLVHRDVSPQNILLGVDGLARLVDFGIARASSGMRAFETLGATLKGKLEYMAPEQVECKPVDRTTDLFAMGIVLWEMLTGRRLFQGKNQVSTIQQVCFDPIPSPRAIDPSITVGVEEACMRALERSRTTRWATAASFAEALEAAARKGEGIATGREVAAYMTALLGEPKARAAIRESAKSGAPYLPDLSVELRHGPGTEQLPASDPMIRVKYPAPSNEAIDTVPDADAPAQGGRPRGTW